MFSRLLLDDEDLLLTYSLFGGLKATLKLRNSTIKASRDEKLHLFRTIEILQSRGVEIAPDNRDIQELFRMFSDALFGQGDARWRAYFLNLTPEQIADSYS